MNKLIELKNLLLVKANSPRHPTMAEANAIRWALELALDNGFSRIIVESDAKSCIDELCSPLESSSWRISALSSHSLKLVSSFSFVSFNGLEEK